MALKEFVGVVVSNKMLNTRIVSVDERVYHKIYKNTSASKIETNIRYFLKKNE